jgi:hypothetical protein
MAACWKCGKRARRNESCAWCGRGPMCLNCKCDCKLWELHESEFDDIPPVAPPTPESGEE